MPGNAFLRFIGSGGDKDVKGESLQEGHLGTDGWIEIGDWSWDIEAETSFLKGTGASVGKPTPGVLSFSHYYDKSSPVIMKYILKGTHFQSIRIDMLKQTGKEDGKPEIYFQLNASDVFITKVASKGGEDGQVTQDVEMVFKAVTVGYRQQLNTGKLEAARKFAWNISEMTDKVPALPVSMT